MTFWDFAAQHPFLALLWIGLGTVIGTYLLLGLAFVLASAQARHKARSVAIMVEGGESAEAAEGKPS